MTSAALSTQVGAASAAMAFPIVGPAPVVAVRQAIAAVVLLAVARPRLGSLTRAQWRPVLGLTVVFAIMNLAVYTAISRIGLGLAVTLEFLGPIVVALVSARSSRSVRTALAAVAAAGGVFLLVRPGTTSDRWGVLIALVGALCWASYIVLNRIAGQRLPGVMAPALATTFSALGYLPLLVYTVTTGRFTPAAFGYAVGAGVLGTAVPYALDLLALRRVPPQVFGVYMSMHPVLAAVVGLVALDQHLAADQWLGILIIAGANVLVMSNSRPPASAPT